jgi:MFS family permease
MTGAPSGDSRRWRPLVALETATLLAAAGNGVAIVAFPWVVLELTGSAADAGLVAAVAGLPLVISAFVSGTVVDRIGRRRTSVVSDVLSGLSVAAVPLAASADVLTLWLLLGLAALGAVFDPAGATAREAMLPEAARAARLRLERMNGIHEAVFNVAFLIGPALGGLLIGFVGAEATLWATAAGFAASAVAITLVRVPGAGRPARSEDPRSVWHDGLEGLAFVWQDRTLRALTILFTALVAAWVPIEGVVLPVYFQAMDEPEQLGIVLMALSAGGLVGALAFGVAGHRVRRRTAFSIGLIGTALPVVGMALLPSLWLLVVLSAATGLMYGPINPITNLALQERVPSRLRGRAIGVLTSMAYAAGPIGFLVIGPLIELVGLRAAFLALSLVLVAVALAAPFVRALGGLDERAVPATA